MARVGAGGGSGPDGVPRALFGCGREAEPAVRPEDDGEGAAVRVRDGDVLVEEDREEAGGGPGVPGARRGELPGAPDDLRVPQAALEGLREAVRGGGAAGGAAWVREVREGERGRDEGEGEREQEEVEEGREAERGGGAAARGGVEAAGAGAGGGRGGGREVRSGEPRGRDAGEAEGPEGAREGAGAREGGACGAAAEGEGGARGRGGPGGCGVGGIEGGFGREVAGAAERGGRGEGERGARLRGEEGEGAGAGQEGGERKARARAEAEAAGEHDGRGQPGDEDPPGGLPAVLQRAAGGGRGASGDRGGGAGEQRVGPRPAAGPAGQGGGDLRAAPGGGAGGRRILQRGRPAGTGGGRCRGVRERAEGQAGIVAREAGAVPGDGADEGSDGDGGVPRGVQRAGVEVGGAERVDQACAGVPAVQHARPGGGARRVEPGVHGAQYSKAPWAYCVRSRGRVGEKGGKTLQNGPERAKTGANRDKSEQVK